MKREIDCEFSSKISLSQYSVLYHSLIGDKKHLINQHPDWIQNYMLVNANKEYFQLSFRHKSEIIGMFLFQIDLSKASTFLTLRTINLIGDGPSDFSNFLIKRGYERDVQQRLVVEFTKKSKNWDYLRLANLNILEKDQVLVNEFEKHQFKSEIRCLNGYMYVNTKDNNWTEFYESFLKPRNKDLLKDLRKVERNGFILNTRTVKKSILPELNKVLELYAQRRETLGQANLYETTDWKGFVESVIGSLKDKGMVELTLLEDQHGEIWAFQLDWIFQNTRYHWNHAFNETFKKFSPGKILLFKLLEKSFEDDDIFECNHMRGLSGYKTKLSTEKFDLLTVHVVNKDSLRLKVLNLIQLAAKVKNKLLN